MADAKRKILFVDDDPVTCSLIQRNCRDYAIDCKVFQSALNCLQEFKLHSASLIVSDWRMPGMSGLELLQEVRNRDDTVPFLIMSGHASVQVAVQAMKLGANDFIEKPFTFEDLRLLIEQNLTMLAQAQQSNLKTNLHLNQEKFGMVGNSTAIRALVSKIEKLARLNCPVMVHGESGSGKERVARALHENSIVSDKPFVVIDCEALSEPHLALELFGPGKDVVGNREKQNIALIECANAGTVFLDEISHIPARMQRKLFRAIQKQSIMSIADGTTTEMNVRVIAASNKNLEQLVASGELRDDFYYRLNVASVAVPPLRSRREDIPALVQTFVDEFARRHRRRVAGFDAKSVHRLMRAPWIGNVSELKNTIERSVIFADSHYMSWPNQHIEPPPLSGVEFFGDQFLSLSELEQLYINHVLACVNGNRSKAAKILQIDKSTLWRKLKKV